MSKADAAHKIKLNNPHWCLSEDKSKDNELKSLRVPTEEVTMLQLLQVAQALSSREGTQSLKQVSRLEPLYEA
jgi:hypothetical protein